MAALFDEWRVTPSYRFSISAASASVQREGSFHYAKNLCSLPLSQLFACKKAKKQTSSDAFIGINGTSMRFPEIGNVKLVKGVLS